MKKAVAITIFGFCLVTGCRNEPAAAPTIAATPSDPPAFVAGTESWVMTSTVTKRSYQISVAVPWNYETTKESYPVLYATDANMHFGTVVETARILTFDKVIPNIIIVGIGYPVGHANNAMSPRAVDLTPTPDPEWVEITSRDVQKDGFPPIEGSGGAPGFLQFIREELIPSIEAKYRTVPDDRAYYGFSFGGLFGTYALLNNEGTFQRFILGSPSLWWNNRVMFEQEKMYAANHKSLPARVFLSMGLDEEPKDNPLSAKFRMVSNLRDFVRVLEDRRYEGLTLQTHYFDGEVHVSVDGATVSRGLRSIYVMPPSRIPSS